MKNQLSVPRAGFLSLLALLLFLTSSTNVEAPVVCDNPSFPGCLPPGSADVFKVLLVLDESGSMGVVDPATGKSAVPAVKSLIEQFASTLNTNATGTGQFEMGIVEFSTASSVGVPLTDVKNSGFMSLVNTYKDNSYNPSGWTDFAAALTTVRDGFTDLDIVFFISDGDPRTSSGPQAQSVWEPIADQIKCSGTYVFGIALGQNIQENNIIALSGPDELNNPKSLPQGADWLREDVSGLPDALVDLANSLVDAMAPVINCPANITQNNDAGACDARIFFSATATDNCTSNPAVLFSPASGSSFPVGVTTVNSTSTDDVGNTGNCSFTVTVVDAEEPTIDCGPAKVLNNDPGACSAKVTLSILAQDNCTANPTVTSNPASGSTLPVGSTLVTSTATDGAGLSTSCSVTVIVLDSEPPTITCPSKATVEAGDSTAPPNTGTPVTADNCSVASVTHTDQTQAGTCIGQLSITRTWKVTDTFGNKSKCMQDIDVVDKTPPVIITPADIVVECDTSTAATGVATATDNGDPNPKVSYTDALVSGDCDYRCIINRTWKAVDDCNNVNSTVQVIEKDITPRLEKVFVDANGDPNPLFLGIPESRNPTSFRVKSDEVACIVQWLPDTNGRPTALKGGKQGVEGRNTDPTSCKPGSNPVDPATGRLVNPLFAEGMKLALYLRLHPEFGDVLLSTLANGCEIDLVIGTTLGPSENVRSFMDSANKALGNQNMTPHEQAWLRAFRCINGQLDLCN